MRLIRAGILIYVVVAFAVSDTYQTIKSLDDYKEQRSCGQACFWTNGAGAAQYDVLGRTLGCTQPVRVSCYCRTDVQVAAEFYLSTCISSRCSGPGAFANDISMATSIYGSYCLENGYTADRSPATVPATTTAAGPTADGPTEIPTVTKSIYIPLSTSNDGASVFPSVSSMYGLLLIYTIVSITSDPEL